LALVLDWGDSSLGSPVNSVWETSTDRGKSGRSDGFGDVHSIVDGVELGGGQISELIESNGESLGGGIVIGNEQGVLVEDGQTVLVFGVVGVNLFVG